MSPLCHPPRIIAWQQAAPYEETQQALAHLRRYRCDGGGLEAAGGMEDHGVPAPDGTRRR